MRTPWRIIAQRLTSNQRDPQAARVSANPRTASSVYVDPDTALKNPVVWACVRYLTQTVAMLPWEVQEETQAPRKSPNAPIRVQKNKSPNSKIGWLIGHEPNKEMSSFTFRETLLSWALLRGNGYAEIEWDSVGRPIALWPIHPERVQIKRWLETGELYYEVNNEAGANSILLPEDMFHIRGLGNELSGYSVIEYAANTIGWAQATEIFGANFFANGLNPSAVIESTRGMGVPALMQFKAELKRWMSGLRKAHTPLVLETGMTYKQVSSDLDKAQFIETRNLQVPEICRWFGVPPHKVQHLLHATFTNIEHQSMEVVSDSIMPWTKRFEVEADRKLVADDRRGYTTTRMDLNELLRADAETRAKYYQSMRNAGALTANEIRQAEGLNPVGEEGEMLIVQSQYVPLQNLLAAPQKPAPQLAPPTTQDLTQEMRAFRDIEDVARYSDKQARARASIPLRIAAVARERK